MRILRITALLAWRNLWRNHRRTLIMLAAITTGVWAMISMTAFIRGMVDGMVQDGIRALPGHVQIHHPEFRDDPSIANVIAPPDERLTAALDGAAVVAWTSRVRVPAVVSSERDSRGVTLLGIDPASEAALSFVADDLSEGRFLESADDKGIIVGRKLLERLETDLGRRIAIMSQDPDNEIVDRGFRIVGVFDSKLVSFEESFVFAGRETVQKLLRVGDQVSEVAILGSNYRNVDDMYTTIAASAPGDTEVLPWYELDRYLGSTLEVMDSFVYIWVVVVFLALSFGLVNTLVMAVFERVREIGLMLALGMKPAMIMSQVIVESLLLLVLGLAAGNALAWLTNEWLSTGIDVSIVAEGLEWFGSSTMLYPALLIEDVIMANVVVLVLGFLASLSPAWRASRYHPVEAITKV